MAVSLKKPKCPNFVQNYSVSWYISRDKYFIKGHATTRHLWFQSLFRYHWYKLSHSHGFLCAFSMWRRLTILYLVLKSHSLHLKSVSCSFCMWSLISFPCFPVNSHREHCTRGIIFASGRVLPFFAKRTEEASKRSIRFFFRTPWGSRVVHRLLSNGRH